MDPPLVYLYNSFEPSFTRYNADPPLSQAIPCIFSEELFTRVCAPLLRLTVTNPVPDFHAQRVPDLKDTAVKTRFVFTQPFNAPLPVSSLQSLAVDVPSPFATT